MEWHYRLCIYVRSARVDSGDWDMGLNKAIPFFVNLRAPLSWM
jgi:hypothetical protein